MTLDFFKPKNDGGGQFLRQISQRNLFVWLDMKKKLRNKNKNEEAINIRDRWKRLSMVHHRSKPQMEWKLVVFIKGTAKYLLSLYIINKQNQNMPQTKASESSSAKISTKSRKNLHNNDVSAFKGGCEAKSRKTSKPLKTTNDEQKHHWNVIENTRYIRFLALNHKLSQSKLGVKKNKSIYSMMSRSVIVRESAQCRSHHQKMMIKFKSIEEIINRHRNLLKPEDPLSRNSTTYENQEIRTLEEKAFMEESGVSSNEPISPNASTEIPVLSQIIEERYFGNSPQSQEESIEDIYAVLDMHSPPLQSMWLQIDKMSQLFNSVILQESSAGNLNIFQAMNRNQMIEE